MTLVRCNSARRSKFPCHATLAVLVGSVLYIFLRSLHFSCTEIIVSIRARVTVTVLSLVSLCRTIGCLWKSPRIPISLVSLWKNENTQQVLQLDSTSTSESISSQALSVSTTGMKSHTWNREKRWDDWPSIQLETNPVQTFWNPVNSHKGEIRASLRSNNMPHYLTQSKVSTSIFCDQNADHKQEPYPGLVIQVMSEHLPNMNSDISMVSTFPSVVRCEDPQNLIDCEETQQWSHFHPSISEYVLLQKIHDELGLIDEHQPDYAYRSVIPRQISSSFYPEDRLDGSQKVKYRSSYHPPYQPQAQPTGFPHSYPPTYPTQDHAGERQERKYETMGDRAFAGGSHGEVWRARRKCYRHFIPVWEDTAALLCRSLVHKNIVGPVQDRNEPMDENVHDEDDFVDDSNTDTGAEDRFMEEPCDDQVELIMKRLKVEHGIDILEAGLREVYFGRFISQTIQGYEQLFTKYVDHFFHKSNYQSEPELWIVFENAGSSLRSYIYTPMESQEFFIYQHSAFWRFLRMGRAYPSNVNHGVGSSSVVPLLNFPTHISSVVRSQSMEHHSDARSSSAQRDTYRTGERKGNRNQEGSLIIQRILKQILMAAAALHEHGIIHRDIKPSNIMCRLFDEKSIHSKGSYESIAVEDISCVLGDFSSAWNDYTSQTLYTYGPSAAEQTDEYAPPEVLFGRHWIPFHPIKPESYDSWSIGVVALELLLGTPNVFSVDQRTRTLLTTRMEREGANMEEIHQALYLSALSQFCIFRPSPGYDRMLKNGHPLLKIPFSKKTCTLQDFHNALRARDPLGIGFDASMNNLLELISGLVAWDPEKRLTAKEALGHKYFQISTFAPYYSSTFFSSENYNALEQFTTDPRIDLNNGEPRISSFICPGCGRKFDNHNSCQTHARSRKHARFCTYDKTSLPPCLVNHPMLPQHPTSGYCDIQGRRPTIEDFHAIHLRDTHQYYGVFDGHNGNLASKYAASSLYEHLIQRIQNINETILIGSVAWKRMVESNVIQSYQDVHNEILQAIESHPDGMFGVMGKSGTTATILLLYDEAIVVANVGDSSAVLSVGASYNSSVSIRPNYFRLTFDHVVADKQEKIRIEHSGGKVYFSGGIERLFGLLALSRSLGDPHVMQYLSQRPHVLVLTREEVIHVCKGSDNMPCFIILASDGLWDVMSASEAVEMVEEMIKKVDSYKGNTSPEERGVFQEAAQALTHEAFIRGSRDNIGVCVVALSLYS